MKFLLTFIIVFFTWASSATPILTSHLMAQAQNSLVFLPYITRGPTITGIGWLTKVNCSDDYKFTNGANTNIEFGIKELAVAIQVNGAATFNYRIEWYVNDEHLVNIDKTGVITKQSEVISLVVISSSNSDCENSLQRGTRSFKLYLGNELFAKGQAIIQ